MDQQARGKFTLNLNYRRQNNADAPPITGRISAPEAPEVEYSFDVWKHESEKGPYWIGPVNPIRSMRQAMTTDQTAEGTHFIAIRMNGFKVFATLEDGSPNPEFTALPPEQQQLENKKPSFWATWTRDPAKDAEIRAAAWDREPTRYGPWASGNTQYPQKSQDRAELGLAPDHEIDLDEPTVPDDTLVKSEPRKKPRGMSR